MAITITSDLTRVTTADATTAQGTWARVNGTNSGNPALEGDGKVQGLACIVAKCGGTVAPSDVGLSVPLTATFDATGKHIFHWRNNTTPSNMSSKANAGTSFHISSEATFGVVNYKRWYLDGGDTDIIGGWKCYVIDPSSAGDISAGAPALTTLKTLAFLHRQLTGVTTTLNNMQVDATSVGTGLTATAGSATDTVSFANLYATDSLNANAWGVITQNAGVYYGAAKITVGSATQLNTCLFKATNDVLVWRDYPVANILYAFNLIGLATFKTTFQLGDKDGSNNTSNGCVVRGQGAAVWNIVCDVNSGFKAYASSLANCRAATLSDTSELRGTAVSISGTMDVNGATIASCSFSGHTATQLKVDTTAEMTAITGCGFSGTGHAIELTATGTYSLSALTFNSYGADGTTSAAIYNNSGGAVTLNIVNGGSTPTVRNGTGASTTVIAGAVTVKVKAVTESGAAISDARVHLEAAAGGPFPSNAAVTITNSTTTATVAHTAHGLATGDKAIIRAASLDANNGVFAITVTTADAYTYTMAAAPGSNPTGTITATFVVLNDLTDVNGEVTMSRVFSANQPVTGQIRKSSGTPYYKNAALTGTVSSATGGTFTGVMISDD